MTNEQIIEGLECCKSFNFNACGKCPYFALKDDIFTCLKVKQNDVSELIKRLMAEKEILSRNFEGLVKERRNETNKGGETSAI